MFTQQFPSNNFRSECAAQENLRIFSPYELSRAADPSQRVNPVGVSSKSSRLPSNVGRFHAEEVTHTHVLRTRRPIEENANLIMIQQVAVGPFLYSLFFHWRPLLKTAAGTTAAAERQDTCNNGFLSGPIFIRLKRMMLDIDKHPPNDWYMFYVFAFVCKS